MVLKRLMVLATGCLALLMTTAQVSAELPQEVSGRASVIDGDSLWVGKFRVRLWGVDAPEDDQVCFLNKEEQECGSTATEKLEDLVEGRKIQCVPQAVDQPGRYLAKCQYEGVDLGHWMVTQGWAFALRETTDHYLAAEKKARVDKLGLWQSNFVYPWEWRDNN